MLGIGYTSNYRAFIGYIFSNQFKNWPRIFQVLQGIAEYPAIRIFSLFPEIFRSILDV